MDRRGKIRRKSCAERLEQSAVAEAEARSPEAWLKRSPAWAFALAVHLLIGVVLMNIVHFASRPGNAAVFRLSFSPPRIPGLPGGAKQGDQDNGINGKHSEDSAPAGPAEPLDACPSGVLSSLPPAPVMTTTLDLPGGIHAPGLGNSGLNGPGGLFAGRGGSGRGDRLKRYGGNAQTEQAVEEGLAWLARHQDSSGGWGTAASAAKCPDKDRCSLVECKASIGTTGLALLAFLGAGYTGGDGAYKEVVQKARLNLLESQTREGWFADRRCATTYSHAIATFALAELFALTQDPDLRGPVTRAIGLIEKGQEKCGGWDYSFSSRMNRGDTSVSTWQVQALRSARIAGLPVRASTWVAAREYFEKMTDSVTRGLWYDQKEGVKGCPDCVGMLACGTIARNYLGVLPDQSQDERAVHRVLLLTPWASAEHPVTMSVYNEGFPISFRYYGTMLLFHAGGEAWDSWNAQMKTALFRSQETKGDAAGSWCETCCETDFCGRAGDTAFSVMDLEVYYRYLPSYADERQAMTPLLDASGPENEPGPIAPRDKSVKELLEDLDSRNQMARWNAAKELSRRREPTAAGPMAAAARAEKTSAKSVLVGYLFPFTDNDAVVDLLIEDIGDPDERVRNAALKALEKGTGQSLGSDAESWTAWRKTRK